MNKTISPFVIKIKGRRKTMIKKNGSNLLKTICIQPSLNSNVHWKFVGLVKRKLYLLYEFLKYYSAWNSLSDTGPNHKVAPF